MYKLDQQYSFPFIGVGHEYAPVFVLIQHSTQEVSVEEAQYMLMVHEQRIEQLSDNS